MAEEVTPVEEELIEETTPEVPEVEEEVEEEPVEEVEDEEPEAAPEEPVEEQPKSRRQDLRIQQLISKMKESQTPRPTKPEALDYSTMAEDPEVVTQLEKDRQNYGDRLYQQGLEQAKSIQFHTRLEIDAPRVAAKFPQLDTNSAEFNPAVADAINAMYLSTVGFDQTTDTVANPNVRYSDYVESFMELVDAAAGEKVSQTTQNIKKQAAATGLRPDGSKAKRLNLNKRPEDMTDEELEAVIAQSLR